MPLSPKEKAERARERMLDTAKKYQNSTYSRKFVAPVFQKMIRAEAACDPRQYLTAIVEGEIRQVERKFGQCVCVTCGRVAAWDSRDMQTGHFLASRRNSILYEEMNVAPQCSVCNGHRSGSVNEYRKWMIYMRGLDVVEHLERLKTQSVTFTRFDLVDMKIDYANRLKAAESKLKSGEP